MHMSPELTKKLTAAVDGMPAFPKSVQRVLELTRDVNSTPKDVSKPVRGIAAASSADSTRANASSALRCCTRRRAKACMKKSWRALSV